jgi:hypothetical protein
LDGAIGLPMHGGHPRRQTWPHNLSFPLWCSRVRAEVGERGKRGDVAADRWVRVVSGTGVGMRWPADAAACWRAESGSGPETRLAAHNWVEGFPKKLSHIFYLIQI